jgi:cardiolipin synthase C
MNCFLIKDTTTADCYADKITQDCDHMPQKNKTKSFLLASSMLSFLTACELSPNTAKSDMQIQSHWQHWLSQAEDIHKIKQGKTAYVELDEAFISIAARVHLIQNAKQHLDLQYYIWKDDKIGNLMLHALLQAADRGVKVRLLLDDQNGTDLDETLKTLSTHPNIQIKLFNPYRFRHFKILDYAFRLKHVNQRMHNKLIIADGAVAVTGGRNISSEYFDASDDFQFTDMDIIFLGHAVENANQTFQIFWNDPLSYNTVQLLGQNQQEDLKQLRLDYQKRHENKDVIAARIQASQAELKEDLNLKEIQWANAYFVADHPNKARQQQSDQDGIAGQIRKHMGDVAQHLDIVSAYFVPTERGADYLGQVAQQDIHVRVLTNSYLANDVPIVHAYYQQYRSDLLKNGVQLWEFKPYIERSRRTWYEVMTGNIIPAKNKNNSSLHAKFFDVDGMVFIGSFNLDPRSVYLNTEVGLIVESENLEQYIDARLDQYLKQIAYELKLDAKHNIQWIEYHNNGQKTVYTQEPNTTKFQRFMFKSIAYTPFEWLM